MFGSGRGLAQLVEDWRAAHNDGRLLVAREMRDWGLVDATSSVYIHSVDNLISRFRVFVNLVLCLILP